MTSYKFAILITTKNRIEELLKTLKEIDHLLVRDDVECIIWDDGSTDDTYHTIEKKYPDIRIYRNERSKGLIYSRNRLLSETTAKYAISLDDDLHFITRNPLELIEDFFLRHQDCAVISFRIFWSTIAPTSTEHYEAVEQVRNFAGGAHVWRMDIWRSIPDYPEWFIFYGEEEFASYQLYRQKKAIYYVPDILCHHRVNLKERKKQKDYIIRLRRSLRSGWYLYALFHPFRVIPKNLAYSLWQQLKLRVFKGDLKALIAIFQAIGDVIINIPRLIKNRSALSLKEFKEITKLPNAKLYWKPQEKID